MDALLLHDVEVGPHVDEIGEVDVPDLPRECGDELPPVVVVEWVGGDGGSGGIVGGRGRDVLLTPPWLEVAPGPPDGPGGGGSTGGLGGWYGAGTLRYG